jgi:sugar phosphate isomerase/epimerase
MKKLSIFLSLLLACGLSTSFAQSGKPLFTGAIGVQAYTYRNSWGNVAATLDTIKSLGITEMEGENPTGVTPDDFKKMLTDRGITITSIGADYGAIIKDPDAVVKQAKYWNVKYVMVAWIPHTKEFTLADAKKAVEDFNRVGKVLADNGIMLCYHAHGYEFGPSGVGSGTLFDYLADNTDPRYLHFELDMMWAFHGGADPAKLLYKYKGRYKLIHLKDIRKGVANDRTGGTPQVNDVALGTGQLNVPEILKAAKAVGIEHYYIEDESPNHAAQIPVTIAYIKSLTE